MTTIEWAPGTATARKTGLGTGFTDIITMSGRELRRTLRSVDSLVTAFAIPVSIMLVFVVIFGGAIQSDGDYVNYVVPGTLVGKPAASTALRVIFTACSPTWLRHPPITSSMSAGSRSLRATSAWRVWASRSTG